MLAYLGLAKRLQSWALFSRNHRHPQCPGPLPAPTFPASWFMALWKACGAASSPAADSLLVPWLFCSSCCSWAEPGTGEAVAGPSRSPCLARVWGDHSLLDWVLSMGAAAKSHTTGLLYEVACSLSSPCLLPLTHLFKSPYACVHYNRKCGAVFSLLLSYALG